MSTQQLGSYIEILVPHVRAVHLRDLEAESIRVVGGMTRTSAHGYYVRADDGTTDCEPVYTYRWDYSSDDPKVAEIMAITLEIVKKLHQLGEEAVLRRSFHLNRYRSELIFKD